MKKSYKSWLQQKYSDGTVQAQMDRVKRLEKYYGDLDIEYDKDELESLISTFSYSSEDARRKKPNPTKIPIQGDIRKGLASCKSALAYYQKFRNEFAAGQGQIESPVSLPIIASQVEAKQTLDWMERDMQSALRQVITQLEDGLEIIDDGSERSVTSGLIDITAKDSSGAIVVIELKTGMAGSSAIGQILGYMGDISEEEAGTPVRGILVAGDFDKKAVSAQKMIPNLSLKKYTVNFQFSDGHK